MKIPLMKHKPSQKISPIQEKKLLKITIVLVLIALLWVLFSPRAGVFALLKQRSELKELQQQTVELQKENVRLQNEIDRIQNDPVYLEEVARKDYGLVRKNELIYDFSKKKPVEKK